jgi:hypothetical protein
MDPSENGVATMNAKRWVLMMVLVVLPPVVAACQQQLFNPSDSYLRDRNNRYYGDSAVETREKRTNNAEMPFGFPTGMANQ